MACNQTSLRISRDSIGIMSKACQGGQALQGSINN